MFRGMVLAVLIATSPAVLISILTAGDDDDYVRLTAGDHRVCDTVLNFPDEVSISPIVGRGPQFSMEGPPQVVEAFWVVLPDDGAAALLDPRTGEVLRTADGENQQLLQRILSTKRVAPATTQTATWPYSENVLTAPERGRSGRFEHRYPDSGSGLVLSYAGSFDGHQAITLSSCRSEMSVYLEPGSDVMQIDDNFVHARDRSAFRTFLREVKLLPTHYQAP